MGAILAGLLLGATFGASATAAVRPTVTAYTRAASCAGLDFYPARSDQSYDNVGALRTAWEASVSQSGSGVFRCDPRVPDRAVVTRVEFTLADSGQPGQGNVSGVQACHMSRSALGSSTAGNYQIMASVPGTTPGIGSERIVTTSIAHATINNAAFGYWLECYVVWPNKTNGIYGADVVYTLSASAG
jgi:hypothetical protein